MIGARGRRVEASQDVHEGGFPTSRGAHERDILIDIDAEVEAIQGMDLLGADVVRFAQPFDGNERFHGAKVTGVMKDTLLTIRFFVERRSGFSTYLSSDN